jgi:ADP-heptose:LPS heptosyltransferase
MEEATSRALDVWIGRPLCWLLTLWRRTRAHRLRTDRGLGPPRKILFVKLSEMGAMVLAVPAFEAARSRVGQRNLYCLQLDGNREVHELIGVFPAGNVLAIRDHNLLLFAWDTARALRRCRREGIDTVIDLEGFARISALLAFLCGAERRIGLDRFTSEGPYRGDLFTHRVPWNPYQHASLQFLTLVEALDAPEGQRPLPKRRVELKEFELEGHRPEPREIEELEAMLARACGGPPAAPRVILNCNLIDALPLRRWPRESFLELGRRILAHHPRATLLLTGLAAERESSRALAAEISPARAFSLAGETPSLRSLVALLARSDLLITSDCGTAHMAALTAIPIVSIFGPETPQLYAPLSPRNRSLWAGLACSPCLNAFNHRRSPCRDNVCMGQITVDHVLEAARRQCPTLDGARGPAAG